MPLLPRVRPFGMHAWHQICTILCCLIIYHKVIYKSRRDWLMFTIFGSITNCRSKTLCTCYKYLNFTICARYGRITPCFLCRSRRYLPCGEMLQKRPYPLNFANYSLHFLPISRQACEIKRRSRQRKSTKSANM